ncbi:MAG: hypothetical protein JW913_05905 [Chitinispirillaceae bacterium]|nr:hypothetical protein [Chitinispirillaceae bacterium]
MNRRNEPPAGGRILRVKKGFNPNSSSIATDIIVFFTAAAGVSALFAAAAGVVMARFSDKPETTADAGSTKTDK